MVANAVLGAQLGAIFIVGGLAGSSLAPSQALSTLPISLIVLGSMLSATPLASIMQRLGRRAGFYLGSALGAGGAAIAAYGINIGSFGLLLFGSLLTGGYMATHAFYRFAAIDAVPEAFRARAISLVMAAGLVSAVIGPEIVKQTAEATVIPFLGTYIAVIFLNLTGAVIFPFLNIPVTEESEAATGGRSRWEMLKTPAILVAVICATVAYSLMNLVMTATPLAVVGCGFTTGDAADVVRLHVLAMFGPAFFTGYLIDRFGARTVVAAGLFILAAAGVVALAGVELGNFYVALVLLGLGWNFGFIGSTAMLASHHSPEERGRIQGMNDTIVFGVVTLASLASGGLMHLGGDAVAGWTAVNVAMVPLLILAGGALVWLATRSETRANL
ncbi:MAG: MFS transporter [Pseudomonadota bacterium]